MPGGVPLNNLVDLFLATSQAVLTAEGYLLNEAQPRNTFLTRSMKRNDMQDMVQGGDRITDQVIFDITQTGVDYQPMESMSASLAQHLTEISIDWKFTAFNVVFDKHEKGLNNAMDLKRGARAMVFKKLIRSKHSNLWVDVNRKFDAQVFAQPNAATMEASGGKTPLSMFCTIHQFGAVEGADKPTAIAPPGFTTIQGVNPTTQPRWRNPVEFYAGDEAAIQGPAGDAGNPQRWDGFTAFSSLYQRLRFKDLAIRPEFGESSEPEGFISTSLWGYKLYELATASLNDHLRHGASNAAYPGLNYEGVPVEWMEQMDFAEVWPDAANTGFAGEHNDSTNEAGGALGDPEFEGPRFVFNVPKFFKKIVHSTHFLEETVIPPDKEQPFSWVVFYDCWHNNWNASRQRCGGIVAPSAHILAFGLGA